MSLRRWKHLAIKKQESNHSDSVKKEETSLENSLSSSIGDKANTSNDSTIMTAKCDGVTAKDDDMSDNEQLDTEESDKKGDIDFNEDVLCREHGE